MTSVAARYGESGTRAGMAARSRTRCLAFLAVGAAFLGAALWWRKHPSACPYGQRFWVEAPHPLITRRRLLAVLEPRPGERVLEVGPGTGYYTLDVAERVAPGGQLDIFDLQQEMLDHTMRRAGARGRLVVGELFGDPHWVSPGRLRRRADAAGLAFDRRTGTPLGYFARFDRPGAEERHRS